MIDLGALAFAGPGLDRASPLRSDAAALERLAARADARTVLFDSAGVRPLVDQAGDLLWHPPEACGPPGGQMAVFLGLDSGAPRFAATQPIDTESLAEGAVFADLRAIMTRMSPKDAAAAAVGRSLLDWHARHRFCAACGAPTETEDAGWQRRCPACNARHFPRTDPVVIMLVTDGDDVLLGRSPGWPEGMYSLLAGFVEPGETAGDAVRREVREEVGIAVDRVQYLASQPWPFPSSLMLGFQVIALSRDLAPDPVEIEHALWMPRDRLMRVWSGQDADIRPPRRGAIAGILLRNWLAGRLE
jgi:NAD+ diphosphatase